MGAEFGAQYIIVEFPLFQPIFRTASLPLSMHITCWVFGVGALVVNIMAKIIFKNEDHYSRYFRFKMSENPDLGKSKVVNFTNKVQSRLMKKQEDLDSSCDSIHQALIPPHSHSDADGHESHDEEEKEA